MNPDPTRRQNGGGPGLVVMAAGIGSRYGGLKQMDPVGPGDEIILDYSVFDAIRAGFEKMIFVIRREIESEFRKKVGRRIEPYTDVAYVFQELDDLPEGLEAPASRTKPWGTAHAALSARHEIDGPFSVINADDFYGPAAFRAVHDHIVGVGVPDEYSMAGYRLENTLSAHGDVSRGVCDVTEDGFLEGIIERTTIVRFEDGIKYREPDGNWVALPGDTTVSMNIWGFTEGFIDHLDFEFRGFLEVNGDDPDAECFLPTVVDDLIMDGRASVRVLPTEEHWFGLTHRDDRAMARRSIRNRIKAGVYPERLWD